MAKAAVEALEKKSLFLHYLVPVTIHVVFFSPPRAVTRARLTEISIHSAGHVAWDTGIRHLTS